MNTTIASPGSTRPSPPSFVVRFWSRGYLEVGVHLQTGSHKTGIIKRLFPEFSILHWGLRKYGCCFKNIIFFKNSKAIPCKESLELYSRMNAQRMFDGIELLGCWFVTDIGPKSPKNCPSSSSKQKNSLNLCPNFASINQLTTSSIIQESN